MSTRASKVGERRALRAQALLVPEPCTIRLGTLGEAVIRCGAAGVVEVAPHARDLRGRVIYCARHARENGIEFQEQEQPKTKRPSARRGRP